MVSIQERNSAYHLHEQIGTLAFENWMLLGVKDDDDVARREAGGLVALALECNPLLILHTLVNVDFENLALWQHLLAVASLASVLLLDLLACAIALGALALHLLHHARAELAKLNLCQVRSEAQM